VGENVGSEEGEKKNNVNRRNQICYLSSKIIIGTFQKSTVPQKLNFPP
jgi:hypothetical protein